MKSALKTTAQIGLVLFVLARIVGVIEFSYQSYLLSFAVAVTLAVLYGAFKRQLDAQMVIHHAGFIAILAVPYGSIQGLVENGLTTSLLIAFTAYSFSQNFWGLSWPVELAARGFGLVRRLPVKRQPAAPKAKSTPTTTAKEQKPVTDSKPAPVARIDTGKPATPPAEKPAATPATPVANAPIETSTPPATASDEAKFFAQQAMRARQGKVNPFVFSNARTLGINGLEIAKNARVDAQAAYDEFRKALAKASPELQAEFNEIIEKRITA